MRRLVSAVRSVWGRPEGRFVVLYLAILGVTFGAIAFRPVDQAVVVPFTGLVTRASGVVLGLLGEDITVRGCELSSPRFAVTIHNGCNGVITGLIFMAGVLAFPAGWRGKALGLAGGLAAIQGINLVRVVSLYYVGALAPEMFSSAHVWVWQSVVIVFGVALWVLWVDCVSRPRADR